ncbi:MAG: GHKL domain-containing protein [Dehalobacterium sp.]
MTYQFLYLISGLFTAYIIYRTMQIFFDKRKGSWQREVFAYTLYYAVTSCFYLLFDIPLFNLLLNLGLIYYITLRYEGDWKRRLLAALFIYALFAIIETMVVLFIGYVDFSLLKNGDFQSEAGIIIMRILCFVIILIMGYCKNIKKGISVPKLYWISICIIPISIVYIMIYLLYIGTNHLLTCLGIALLLLVMMSVFVLYDSIISNYENLLSKKQLEQQTKYYDNQLKLMKASTEQLKRFRHDVINHFNTVYSLVTMNKNEKALEYMKTIHEVLGLYETYANTGVDEVDSVLNYKLTEAKQKDIQVNLELEIPQSVELKGFDITVILSNLLDNAIEACQRLDQNKTIKVVLKYKKGRLIIIVQNTFDGQVNRSHAKIQTRKQDKQNHGLGLSQIERIVEQYNGDMKVKQTDTLFTTYIVLYLD